MIFNISVVYSKTHQFLKVSCLLLMLFFSLSGAIRAQSDFSGQAFDKPEASPSRVSKFQPPLRDFSASEITNQKRFPEADGDLDPTFNTSVTEGSGLVRETVVQPDGKIVVVGSFQRANGSRVSNITRLNADGTLDTSFNTGTGTEYGIEAVALQSDGKIIIGGDFAIFNGQAVNRMARLNADGSLDSSFNASLSGGSVVYDVLILPNGKLLVGGYLGNSANLVRLNSNGTFDSVIGNFNGSVNTIALAPDGKIVAGGQFSQPRNGVARFNADGSLDASFNPTTGSDGNLVIKVIVQPNGKILAAGQFLTFNGTLTDGLVRLNDNGAVDAAFDLTGETPLYLTVVSLALQPDGKILVSFNYLNNSLQSSIDVRRFNADATADPTFNTNTDNRLYALDLNVLADGSILVGGVFLTINNQQRLRLVKLNSNGTLVNNFNPAISTAGTVYASERQADGKIIIAGIFYYVNGVAKNLIARLNPDGSLDNTFNPSPELFGAVYDLVIQPNGKIIIGGAFGGTALFPGTSLVRLNSDGSFDINLNTNDNKFVNTAYALTLQADGKFLVGGEIYNRTSPAPPPVVIRYNPDGSLDGTFNPPTVSNVIIRDILIQPNGKIVIGGRFFPQTNFQRRNIAGLNSNGTLNTGFSTDNQQDIYTLTQQSDGKVYAAGFRLSRYTFEGTPDTGFNDGSVNGTIFDVETQPNGTVLIGGYFTNYNGASVNRLARVSGSGSLDTAFTAGTSGIVFSLASQPDGKILVGGTFLDFNGAEKSSLAKLQNSAVRRQTLFDWDGDGKADVSVFRPTGGIWYLLQSQNGFTGIQFGSPTDKIVPADYDGDGKTDVAVYRGGTWYLQRSSLGFTGIAFGTADDIPVPADYDGDGKADLAVFRPSNGTWYLLQSTLGFTGVNFGQIGDKPVAADYDGDGRTDIAVNRNGVWYLQRSQLGFTGIAFGTADDKLVPADYDGDNKADVAVFRPSNGVWYLLQSQAGFAGIAFGLETDLPTAADYDGDGKTDLAVFRNGIWYLNRSQAGFTGIAFGAAGDKPVPNSFVP